MMGLVILNHNMELGTRIVTWLRLRGMTQRKLAKLVGVSGGAVTSWVKGETSPTQKNLLAIADALGLSLAEFFGAPPVKTIAA